MGSGGDRALPGTPAGAPAGREGKAGLQLPLEMDIRLAGDSCVNLSHAHTHEEAGCTVNAWCLEAVFSLEPLQAHLQDVEAAVGLQLPLEMDIRLAGDSCVDLSHTYAHEEAGCTVDACCLEAAFSLEPLPAHVQDVEAEAGQLQLEMDSRLAGDSYVALSHAHTHTRSWLHRQCVLSGGRLLPKIPCRRTCRMWRLRQGCSYPWRWT